MKPERPPNQTPPGAKFKWVMENAIEHGFLRPTPDVRKISENQRLRVYNRVKPRSTRELIELETERELHLGKPPITAQSEALVRVSRWVVEGKIKQG